MDASAFYAKSSKIRSNAFIPQREIHIDILHFIIPLFFKSWFCDNDMYLPIYIRNEGQCTSSLMMHVRERADVYVYKLMSIIWEASQCKIVHFVPQKFVQIQDKS